ncbi:solute carrier family 22 member 15-like [Venturia canescens]|uniref:solute carrier family 22 member 15-like n=1 Tax=Venturia canescens TaxID=32260 RepID=UPI001C9C56CE|nr:solute carrier family 22 member 15-like [Venturia canescens]
MRSIANLINCRDPDLLKLPKDFMDASVGSGRWQILVTLMLSFITFIHLLNTGNETLLRPPGWWCKMPDFIAGWTDVQWILYSHYKDSYKRACSNGTILSSLWLSSSTFGRIGGYMVFGTLSDWVGRKSVIFIACGATPMTALLVASSSDYTIFVVASIVHGFFHGGFAVSMILVLEISTNSWRTGLMAISCGSFALGIGLTPVISGVFDSYDQMIVFINLLCVVMFVSSRFLPESPAWLFCTRDAKSLAKTIRTAAEVNQRQLSAQYHDKVRGKS